MSTFRAYAGDGPDRSDLLVHDRTVETLRWRDIAVPVGRGPVVELRTGDAEFAGPLEMLRGILLRNSEGWTSPSAGAIYPFELWAHDDVTGALGHVDLVRRRVVTTSVEPFRSAPRVMLVLRPWLSVRKYGSRGLAYTLLDAGHALVNMQIGASMVATDATALSLGTANTALPVGRFPIAELSGVPARPVVAGEPQWWLERLASDAKVAEVGEYEELFARRLLAHWQVPPVDLPVRTGSEVAARLARQLRRRRSAASFVSGLPPEDVRSVVTAGAADSRALGWAEILPPVESALFSRATDVGKFTMDNLFHQQHLVTADHIVALSVPLPGGQAPVTDLVASSILAAGMVGQCLYLEATQRGLAATGVGGFVPTSFRSAASTWPVYCMAYGRLPEQRQIKEDALAINRAHGFGS
ncbi:hypothetical protein JOD64_005540 [Micromonospora luteifusca]|uniref:Nitroreductase domain-containing protein n=1 Tax=Micromonospora luteifusca TaxID=709860 RepID=A0ABS2M2V1_9ACTN|nr:hypothetical protein [Micromonospora luteifusca]MBM7494318.1 hypothetical protein [Micromonospora luteifusca]